MSDTKRICPHCGKGEGNAWIRRWDVQRGKLLPAEHVGCAMEEINADLNEGERRAAVN